MDPTPIFTEAAKLGVLGIVAFCLGFAVVWLFKRMDARKDAEIADAFARVRELEDARIKLLGEHHAEVRASEAQRAALITQHAAEYRELSLRMYTITSNIASAVQQLTTVVREQPCRYQPAQRSHAPTPLPDVHTDTLTRNT